jgi:transposase
VIGPGTGVRVYVPCHTNDGREGIAGLSAIAQNVLRLRPPNGAVFAFRGRRSDRVQLLFWVGHGFWRHDTVLEKGCFPWPSAADGAVRQTSAQLALLRAGTDWCRPNWGARPARDG